MSLLGRLFKWDDEIGGGAGGVRVVVPEFERAFACHDQHYDDLRAGTSRKTLKEIDREFLRNMMRAAWAAPDAWRRVALLRRAWLFYRAVRIWAKAVRPELEAYRVK